LNLAGFSFRQSTGGSVDESHVDDGEPISFSFGAPAVEFVTGSGNSFQGLMFFDDDRSRKIFEVGGSFCDSGRKGRSGFQAIVTNEVSRNLNGPLDEGLSRRFATLDH
jgi:hypothetical protein